MMKKRLIFIWINNSQLQNENKGIVLSGKYDIDLQFSQWGETTAFVMEPVCPFGNKVS